MASTAVWTVPNAVIMTTVVSGVFGTNSFEQIHTGDLRHFQVGDDEGRCLLLHERDRLQRAESRHDVIAGLFELQLHRSAKAIVVIHDQSLASIHTVTSCRRGSSAENVIPRSEFASAVRIPPCCSTIWCATGNPRPVPLSFVVKNGSKILSLHSEAIPQP